MTDGTTNTSGDGERRADSEQSERDDPPSSDVDEPDRQRDADDAAVDRAGPGVGRDEDGRGSTVRLATTPTLRPIYVLLGLTLGLVVTVGGVLLSAPGLLGDPAVTEIVLYAIGVLTVLVVARLGVKALVLTRTEYQIRDDALVRRYSLFYKRQVREVPLSKLRGHEYVQGRIQSLLGYGTIRFLTAGTNRSLGFLEFEHLNDPQAVRDEIRSLSARRELESE